MSSMFQPGNWTMNNWTVLYLHTETEVSSQRTSNSTKLNCNQRTEKKVLSEDNKWEEKHPCAQTETCPSKKKLDWDP